MSGVVGQTHADHHGLGGGEGSKFLGCEKVVDGLHLDEMGRGAGFPEVVEPLSDVHGRVRKRRGWSSKGSRKRRVEHGLKCRSIDMLGRELMIEEGVGHGHVVSSVCGSPGRWLRRRRCGGEGG